MRLLSVFLVSVQIFFFYFFSNHYLNFFNLSFAFLRVDHGLWIPKHSSARYSLPVVCKLAVTIRHWEEWGVRLACSWDKAPLITPHFKLVLCFFDRNLNVRRPILFYDIADRQLKCLSWYISMFELIRKKLIERLNNWKQSNDFRSLFNKDNKWRAIINWKFIYLLFASKNTRPPPARRSILRFRHSDVDGRV